MFIYNLLVAYCQFKELLCQSGFWHVCLILRYAWALSLLERERGRGDGIKRCCKERRKRFEEKEMPIRRDVKRSKVQWKHVKMECQEKEATVDKSKRRDVKRNRWQKSRESEAKKTRFQITQSWCLQVIGPKWTKDPMTQQRCLEGFLTEQVHAMCYMCLLWTMNPTRLILGLKAQFFWHSCMNARSYHRLPCAGYPCGKHSSFLNHSWYMANPPCFEWGYITPEITGKLFRAQHALCQGL